MRAGPRRTARGPRAVGRTTARRRSRAARLRGLLLGDLAAEVPEQRVETAVEALADGGEPPDVLEIEVPEHQRAFGAEFGAVERVPDDLFATRDDPYVAGTHLGHLSGAVDGGREREPPDGGGNAVERDAERFGVAGLRAEQLD